MRLSSTCGRWFTRLAWSWNHLLCAPKCGERATAFSRWTTLSRELSGTCRASRRQLGTVSSKWKQSWRKPWQHMRRTVLSISWMGHSWACSAGASVSNPCSTIGQRRASNVMDSRRKEVNCSSLPPFPWDDFYQRLFFLQWQTVSFFLKHHKQFINRR